MSDINLNIGCGGHRIKDYIGIDLYPQRGVDVVAPAHDLPYDAGTVSHIYTQHMVEHLSPRIFNLALIEWHRVLKLNAKLTIRCPNFEYWVRNWLDAPDSERWPHLIHSIIGNADRGDGHLTRNAFTPNRLRQVINGELFTVTECHTMPSRYGVEGADCWCEAKKI